MLFLGMFGSYVVKATWACNLGCFNHVAITFLNYMSKFFLQVTSLLCFSDVGSFSKEIKTQFPWFYYPRGILSRPCLLIESGLHSFKCKTASCFLIVSSLLLRSKELTYSLMLRNWRWNNVVHAAIWRKAVNFFTVYWKQTGLFDVTFSAGRWLRIIGFLS